MQARSLSSPGRPLEDKRKVKQAMEKAEAEKLEDEWVAEELAQPGLRALLLTAEPTSGTAPAGGPVGPSRLAPPVMG